MDVSLHYGPTAKAFHWSIALLLVVQYAIGWLMPDIHRGPPGTPMILHISFGMVVLVLIGLRLMWRVTHPVAPHSALPAWQRLSSEAVHWMLYLAVVASTVSGWLFASYRGWSVAVFNLFPLPMLAAGSDAGVKSLNGLHQTFMWLLLALVCVHVLAALAHLLFYRDKVMQRMLPGIG